MKWTDYSILMILAMTIVIIKVYHDWRTPDVIVLPEPAPVTAIPDFGSYKDVKAKKNDFFNFLLPMIRNANSRQLKTRASIAALAADAAADQLKDQDRSELYALAKRYRVDTTNLSDTQLIDRLLLKVDAVPASLILAQGANESAWGTSRFARKGNNLFGIWCFSPGCGLTPLRRDEKAVHEVERFDTVQQGVEKYIRTINSHPAYKELRRIRFERRQNGESVSGVALARGLEKYSERGHEYIEEIQSMIRFNQLEQFNRNNKMAASAPLPQTQTD